MEDQCGNHIMESLPGDGEGGLTAKICWRCLQRIFGIGDKAQVFTHEEWLKEIGETYK